MMSWIARHKRSLGVLILAGFTAGCAGDAAERLFVPPGRFDYLSCSELVAARQKSAQREQELKTLIDRAEKEPMGVVLAAGSYRGEYLQVQGEQKAQTEVMERKKCPPDTVPRPLEPSKPERHKRR